MIIGDEIESLALVLKADGGFHRAEEIADVEFSARLEAGENAHGAECGFRGRNRSSGSSVTQEVSPARERAFWMTAGESREPAIIKRSISGRSRGMTPSAFALSKIPKVPITGN